MHKQKTRGKYCLQDCDVSDWKEHPYPIWVLRLYLSVTRWPVSEDSLAHIQSRGNTPDHLTTHPVAQTTHHPAQNWVSCFWQHMAIPLCKRSQQAMVGILVWYLLSLIFASMETLKQFDILARLWNCIVPSGKAAKAVDWTGPVVSMPFLWHV